MLRTDRRALRRTRDADRHVADPVVLRPDGTVGYRCVACGAWVAAWGADERRLRVQRRRPVWRANPTHGCVLPSLRARGETRVIPPHTRPDGSTDPGTLDHRRSLGWYPTRTGVGCDACLSRASHDVERWGRRRWPTLILDDEPWEARRTP